MDVSGLVETASIGRITAVPASVLEDCRRYCTLVVASLTDHVGLPLGRFPGTLELEARKDGLHGSVDPPRSREDIREAVERGDLKAASWRMVVARDEWRGDVRHVLEIAQLRDVSIVTRPAY